MNQTLLKLQEAECKAKLLFDEIENRGIIKPFKTEKEINAEIFNLASKLFGIEKFWHKRIVRAGENTLRPYDDNPPDLMVQDDDIVFLDFGPIFEKWEADIAKTYVLGNDPTKMKLKNDVEKAWYEVKAWVDNQKELYGSDLFDYVLITAKKYGWEFGGEIAGHLIGQFPHERLEPGNHGLYIHPENKNDIFLLDINGNPRHWILEIHFVDREKKIGGFFEQLLM